MTEVGTIVTAIVVRSTREGLWEMPLEDIDLHAMAEEIIEAQHLDGGQTDG